jgi:hypothetical protein
MDPSMRELRETATLHMARDMNAARKWICTCDACHEIRALMGMDKLLGIWPLVRALERLHDEMEQMPDGPQKQSRRAEWEKLYDQLAAEMAR